MHIMEGFLPHPWWEIWWAIMIPIVAYGIYKLSKIARKNPEAKPLLALMGAFIFVVSALKLPSVFGSSSHPTGSGLAAVVFGPAIASVLSMIALIFQATLLAHGGITTLGANVFSMGIIGPAIAYVTWIICKKIGAPTQAGVFLAVALSDLFTYVTTSVQLALAFPATGFTNAFLKFASIFAVTQIPLAIGEGILAIFIFEFLIKYKSQILVSMKVIRSPIAGIAQKAEVQLKKKHYIALIGLLLALFITPLIFVSTNFAGTDDAAVKIITQQGYQPWFKPAWTLPTGWQTPLFVMQALIGASIITYIVLRERKKHTKTSQSHIHKGHKHSHDDSHSHLSAQIDSYAYTNALAKASPTTKILLAASTLILSALSPSPIVPITVFIIATFLIVAVAQIPGRFYFDLLIYPLILAAVSCVFIALFFGSGAPLMEIALPWFKWTIYNNGITTAFTTFFRVLGAVSAIFFLVLTTSMTDIFISLRKIHLPKTLIEISLLIYRYIFVFMEVSSKMNTAQKLRLGQTGWLRRIRSTALLAGNLFIRTLEQGERTFIALSARGYDGNIRVLEDQPKASKATLA
ncbi:MAG TPA: energy-coupling factor ABC transporter permease, partial [Candidatus Binatia bacterium]|nr:energy-coupling factor ABC transporter permease [Candidatus Binatia bacterium]